MFCKKCGAQISGTPFCTNCGEKAEQSPSAPAVDMDATVMASDTASAFAAAQAEQPVYQQPVYQQPVQPQYQQPVYQQPAYQEPYGYGMPGYQPEPPKKKNTGLIIGVAVSVVAIIAIVLVILFGTGVIGGKDEDDVNDEPDTTAAEVVSEQESLTVAELTTQMPTAPVATVPQPTEPATNYVVGRSYTYLPVSIGKLGYTKMAGRCDWFGDEMYFEVDYGNDIYSNGGLIYVKYSESEADYCIKIQNGYFWVYKNENGTVTDVTSDFEEEEIKDVIAEVQLMGFDVDEAFENLLGEMPSSYVYSGEGSHPTLGTVDIFTCTASDSEYIIWIDQDTGITARLYEDGEIGFDFTTAIANNSYAVTDYSTY